MRKEKEPKNKAQSKVKGKKKKRQKSKQKYNRKKRRLPNDSLRKPQNSRHVEPAPSTISSTFPMHRWEEAPAIPSTTNPALTHSFSSPSPGGSQHYQQATYGTPLTSVPTSAHGTSPRFSSPPLPPTFDTNFVLNEASSMSTPASGCDEESFKLISNQMTKVEIHKQKIEKYQQKV